LSHDPAIFVEMASFHTHLLSGAEKMTIVQVIPPDADGSLLADLGEEGLELLRTACCPLQGSRWLLQVTWRMPYYYLTRQTDKRQQFYTLRDHTSGKHRSCSA
jgi:hypothetical protein